MTRVLIVDDHAVHRGETPGSPANPLLAGGGVTQARAEPAQGSAIRRKARFTRLRTSWLLRAKPDCAERDMPQGLSPGHVLTGRVLECGLGLCLPPLLMGRA
jgi:hypothetical protein